ncbi:MAG: DNA repair protein RecN, partial [Thermoleophilia bacterium]|nr:DNA repair protein RecN [Thermoleophilia bacterium]
GAGKSILIDAVSTLLGGRAISEFIRSGAEGAHIEGVFVLSPALAAKVQPILQEYGLEGDENTLILSREINRSGRNICRVNGRATTLTALRQIAQQLVDIHGQGEHTALLRPAQHIDFLDRYAGLGAERQQLAAAVHALRQTRHELGRLLQDEREIARRVDLLQYQIAEIAAARLQPGEEEELIQERNRLANAERLISLATNAYAALSGGDEQTQAAMDALDKVMRNLINLERLDS